MKPWRKQKMFFIVFIVLLLFEFSCQDPTCTCVSSDRKTCADSSGSDPDCCSNYKTKYISSTSAECYDCGGISGYYTFDSSNNCINDCLGDKIIYDTKECTNRDLSSLYKLGDFYYHDISAAGNTDCDGTQCKCEKYYYIETEYGKKKYTCFNTVDDNILNIYKYFNSKTGEFLKNQCPDGLKREKKNALSYGSNSATRCSDTCLSTEFFLAIPESDGNIMNEYCVDSCSSQTIDNTYKYEYVDNGVKKCLKDCPSGTYKKDDSTHPACVTLDKCNYYKFDKCYDTCPTTAIDTVDTTIYKYNNYGNKECVSACGTDYIYKTSSTDVTCYKKEHCNFIGTSNTCLSSCTDYHDYNSKLCTTNCGDGTSTKKYHANDGVNANICFDSCSDIPGGEYIFEEADNTNTYKICYKTDASCEAYYKKGNVVRKCITKQDCINTLHYNYCIGKECKESCDG